MIYIFVHRFLQIGGHKINTFCLQHRTLNSLTGGFYLLVVAPLSQKRGLERPNPGSWLTPST